jgi:outer membrane protein OmpA-like peptidoglycan-associated protein
MANDPTVDALKDAHQRAEATREERSAHSDSLYNTVQQLQARNQKAGVSLSSTDVTSQAQSLQSEAASLSQDNVLAREAKDQYAKDFNSGASHGQLVKDFNVLLHNEAAVNRDLSIYNHTQESQIAALQTAYDAAHPADAKPDHAAAGGEHHKGSSTGHKTDKPADKQGTTISAGVAADKGDEVHFALGSATLANDAEKNKIHTMIDAAIAAGHTHITVEGHTDTHKFNGKTADESAKLNMALSQQRADAVKAEADSYLKSKGISGVTIDARGVGTEGPEDTKHGLSAANRRATVASDMPTPTPAPVAAAPAAPTGIAITSFLDEHQIKLLTNTVNDVIEHSGKTPADIHISSEALMAHKVGTAETVQRQQAIADFVQHLADTNPKFQGFKGQIIVDSGNSARISPDDVINQRHLKAGTTGPDGKRQNDERDTLVVTAVAAAGANVSAAPSADTGLSASSQLDKSPKGGFSGMKVFHAQLAAASLSPDQTAAAPSIAPTVTGASAQAAPKQKMGAQLKMV